MGDSWGSWSEFWRQNGVKLCHSIFGCHFDTDFERLWLQESIPEIQQINEICGKNNIFQLTQTNIMIALLDTISMSTWRHFSSPNRPRSCLRVSWRPPGGRIFCGTPGDEGRVARGTRVWWRRSRHHIKARHPMLKNRAQGPLCQPPGSLCQPPGSLCQPTGSLCQPQGSLCQRQAGGPC